jgi:hypothetical protein
LAKQANHHNNLGDLNDDGHPQLYMFRRLAPQRGRLQPKLAKQAFIIIIIIIIIISRSSLLQSPPCSMSGSLNVHCVFTEFSLNVHWT